MRYLKGLVAATALMASLASAVAAELVMYRRAGCPYCEAFDREIAPAYPKTDIGKKLPLREIDIRSGDQSVKLKAPVRYTPTFVLVEDGREVGRIEGYPGDDFFWARLGNLLELLPPAVKEAPKEAPKGVSAPASGVGRAGRVL